MGLIPFNYLIFGGKNSLDYGVWISGGGTYNAPARDVEMISVPGRNGDITFDNGRFQNIVVTYPAFISRQFEKRISEFRSWLCSNVGYQRLEDTYHPDEFRLGIYKSGLDVATSARNVAGNFDLTFECKPQRFLKAGEIPIEYTVSGDHIYNPTPYTAKPLIRCYGQQGALRIGDDIQISITGCTDYVDIDCELMECYEGSTSRNSTTTLTNGEFPRIEPGNNIIAISTWSKVVIYPRWWVI